MVFPVVMYGYESWTINKAECQRIDDFELWCWRDCWESLGLQGDQASQSQRKPVLSIHWKDWRSNTLATWWEELTHWERPWCWERLKAGEEEGDRGWDCWMASPTQWTGIGANSGRKWRTQKPGMLQFTGLQRVRHNLPTEQQQQRLNRVRIKRYYFKQSDV